MIFIAAFSNFSNHIRFAARAFLVPLFGNDILFLSGTEVGLILSFSTILNIIIAVPGGMIVDKYGRKVSIHRASNPQNGCCAFRAIILSRMGAFSF
jgi:MFS family permease